MCCTSLLETVTQHGAGCPARGGFTGGLRRTLPDMFIGHSEIVAFLLYRFSRQPGEPLPTLRLCRFAAGFRSMRLGKQSFTSAKSPDPHRHRGPPVKPPRVGIQRFATSFLAAQLLRSRRPALRSASAELPLDSSRSSTVSSLRLPSAHSQTHHALQFLWTACS